MGQRHGAAKSRYRTVMPSFMANVEYRLPESAHTQTRKGIQSQEPMILSYNVSPHESTIDFTSSHDLTNDASSKQALFSTDSILPYQRSIRARDIKDEMIRLDSLDTTNTSSSERLSPPELGPSTKSSGSSDLYSEQLDLKQFDREDPSDDLVAVSKFPLHTNRSSPESHNDSKYGGSNSRNRVHEEGLGPSLVPSSVSKVKQLQSPTLPTKNPRRPYSSDVPNLPALSTSLSTSSHVTSPPYLASTSRPLKIERLRKYYPPPRLTSKAAWTGHSPIHRPETSARETPQKVRYENVDGVELDTQPRAAREKQTGLSLPEVEANDIRQIHVEKSIDETSVQEYESMSTQSSLHVARPPPPIGTDRHGNTRSISPRPVIEPRQHVFVDGYSQASQRRGFDQTIGSPQIIPAESDWFSGDDTSSLPLQHSLKGRLSSFKDVFASPPSPIPERSREDLLDDFDFKNSQTAEPPSIGLHREFKKQNDAMTRGLRIAKSLVSGIP